MLEAVKHLKRSAELRLERRKHRHVYTEVHDNVEADLHIREAAGWLKRAQDSGSDRGVAYGVRFGEGFLASYPETTGYIIPTFLTLAEAHADPEYLERAVEMGDWEIRIQMECGAVMGGRADTRPTPAVFNTGMVMLGWLSLYEATGESRFVEASERAAAWLTRVQEPDGRWCKGNSRFADPTATVYNTRVAWALARHGKVTGEGRYVEAAVRNAEHALARQAGNGWFSECCLSNPETPLVHTLAYATRGFLELGILLGSDDFIAAARKTADALLGAMEDDGHLAGRFDAAFRPAVPWCCLTGAAQISIVWSKLFAIAGEARYLEGASKVNRYLMQRHDITSPDPAIRGGVPGSWPVWGAYGRFMILNWATKFFIDALMVAAGADVRG